jgi:hypothetical protein
MPTENPKISAYVPQIVYDHFDEFRQKSGLSMSQSAAVIFAKFFGLEDIAKGITGETTTDNSALDRIGVLESQVNDLFQKFSELEGKPQGSPSLSLSSESEATEIIVSSDSNLKSKPPDNLPTGKTDTSGIQVGNLLEELELLVESSTQINPIMGKTLAKRLILPSTRKSISPSKLSIASKKAPEDFVQWTMSLDIDGIGWKYKGRKIGYVPVGELSDELRSGLFKWIKENS